MGRKISFIIEYHKANNTKRFLNHLIDLIAFYIFTFIIGFLWALLMLFLDFNIDYLVEDTDESDLIFSLLSLILYIIFFFSQEYFLKGRTIGKYITGTKVYTEDGEEPTAYQYFIRSISRIVPFEPFSFFGEKGWHDSWSHTYVVEMKSFEEEIEKESRIEEIGKDL